MAIIKGNKVWKAKEYELFEKADGEYIPKATNTECRFDTDELDLAEGEHTFVVKAKAEGFKDSPFSNEVVVNGGGCYTLTIESDECTGNNALYINGKLVKDYGESLVGTYNNVSNVEIVNTGLEYSEGLFITEDDMHNDDIIYFSDCVDLTWKKTLTADFTIYRVGIK